MHLKDAKYLTLFSKTNFAVGGDAMAGAVFYKQLVAFGEWVNPMFPIESMTLDKEWGLKVAANFESGIVGKIPVPLNHTDDVEANAGELVKLEVQDDGLYGYLEIRRPDVIGQIRNGLIFDVSIGFDWDFVDTKTGETHGPAIFHVALVNNPYLSGMQPFAEISDVVNEFSAGLAKPLSSSVIMLSKSKAEELNRMKTVKITNDKAFAVDVKYTDADGKEQTANLAAGAEHEVPAEQQEAVEKQITDATDPNGGNGDGTGDNSGNGSGDGSGSGDGAGNGAGSGNGDGSGTPPANETKEQELARVRKENAELKLSQRYDTLLKDGKITPAQKAKFEQLSKVEIKGSIELSGKAVSLVDVVADILAAGPNVLKLSQAGSQNQDTNSVKLSDDERTGFKAVGADPKKYEELVASGRIKPDESE